MAVSLLLARLVLAAVFAVAGCAKLADLAGSRQAVRDFGVPTRLAPVAGVALPVVELLVAVALMPRVSARWGGLAALVLLAVFVVVIAIALRRDVTPDCQLHARPVGAETLVRNVVLAALAGFVLVAGWRDSGLSVSTGLVLEPVRGLTPDSMTAGPWNLPIGGSAICRGWRAPIFDASLRGLAEIRSV